MLGRLKEAGLPVNSKKCSFLKTELKFLGFVLNKLGISSDPSKVEAIIEYARPFYVKSLQSFLELITHLIKYIPNASILLSSLYSLLKKEYVKFDWNSECESAFINVKEILKKSNFLAHFNPNLPVSVKCDTSPYSIGRVVFHVIEG